MAGNNPYGLFWYPAGIIKKKSRLVGEPSDRRLSSLVRRALVGLKIFFKLNVCYGLNAELLTLLVWMGVHPKVFPDCMHTSVSNLVQHGKFHWEESAKKRKRGQQHLNLMYFERGWGVWIFFSQELDRVNQHIVQSAFSEKSSSRQRKGKAQFLYPKRMTPIRPLIQQGSRCEEEEDRSLEESRGTRGKEDSYHRFHSSLSLRSKQARKENKMTMMVCLTWIQLWIPINVLPDLPYRRRLGPASP
jgi:hypothetical protein